VFRWILTGFNIIRTNKIFMRCQFKNVKNKKLLNFIKDTGLAKMFWDYGSKGESMQWLAFRVGLL
jgi:hypothetical protein